MLMNNPEKIFQLQITISKEAYNINKHIKNSRTVGDDKITMDFLKKIPHDISLVLQHMVNKIIQTKPSQTV